MSPAKFPKQLTDDLCMSLGKGARGKVLDFSRLIRKRLVPRDLGLNPDLCIVQGKQHYLVHSLVTAEVPEWVSRPIAKLHRKFPNTHFVILVREADTKSSWGIASNVADTVLRLGAGLAIESAGHVLLVFPPRTKPPSKHRARYETGYIPSWLLQKLADCGGFSPYLATCLRKFSDTYAEATSDPDLSYDDECDILYTLSSDLRRGDTRLFIPVGRLSVLQEWERARGQDKSRDHFFHTFNNLLSGFLLLGQLLLRRNPRQTPDCYIADTGSTAKLAPWEALWSLTCLFHDPGYVGEKFWSTVWFSMGLSNQLPEDEPLPERVVEALQNASETEYAAPRQDLLDLYERCAKQWQPRVLGTKKDKRFELAFRKAYFDGRRTSHSLLSGLNLIQACRSDKAKPSKAYDREKALKACEIAALSIMFHDQHCRAIFVEKGVTPISFEELPYAATLMFVDAIQDDRRDITKSRFPKHGVLRNLDVRRDENIVRAEVCLQEVDVRWWPVKIKEYESVMNWINAESGIKFAIDYQTNAWNW